VANQKNWDLFFLEELKPPTNLETKYRNHPGEKGYKQYCLACHMNDGNGTPGIHPPIVNTKWTTGNNKNLIEITLNGMSGQIKVKGEVYNNLMPPHSHLTNKQITDVLTYIRLFYNKLDKPITAKEVQQTR
jgi:mono/diheme cytochrome c family protein